jgi:glycosyltransferase involved in cell wall biosynthesis
MVYFGMSPWEGMWKSRHQLMSRFSREMPVVYVEPPVSLRALRTERGSLSRIFADLGRGIGQFEPNVTVFHSPSYLPVSGSQSLAGITRGLWLRAIRKTLRKAGIRKPIVWLSRPERQFIIGEMDETFSIYHAVDEYAGYTGLGEQARQRLLSTEAAVMDNVDLIVVASPELEHAKRGDGRDILVLENGVEPTEYAHAKATGIEPEDLAAIPGPRIGYSGLIGKRLDIELIRAAAEHRPDCSFVLMGKVDPRECEDALAALEALPNVFLLGEKPGSEVASYVVGFDVGLLPYAINLETRHISPIKMYEYWAAGVPVVSTAIPAAERHDFAVDVANSRQEFLSLIDGQLDRAGSPEADRLVELANQNSWQSRVDTIANELRRKMGLV